MKPTLIRSLLSGIVASLFQASCGADGVAVQWEKRYNGTGNSMDEPYGVAVDSAGNVIVTGLSIGNLSASDYYTAKYAAADGALIWEKRYNGPFNNDDSARAVAVDSAGNVIVTGSSIPITTGIRWTDIYTAKYAAEDGALLWERRYNGPANGRDFATAVAVDNAGNAIVTGTSSSSGSTDMYDFYTAKYAAANGALLWERRYNGPANGNDGSRDVAVDIAGNVIVAGYSSNSAGGDMYTAKYAAANGALLWEKRNNGTANGGGDPASLALDDQGNVIVAGTSTLPGNSGNFYTAKFAATNGALIWEKHYTGTGVPFGRAVDVAIDNEANVIATGYRHGSSGIADIYTAKYAAADGALLWEKSYTGPHNLDDRASRVAVESNGNAVVLGRSYIGGGASEFYIARLAAANGSLLWELRLSGLQTVITDEEKKLLRLTPDGGIAVAASTGDYLTVKYAPVDLDLDDDGLLDTWEVAHFGSTNAHSALDDTDGDGAVDLLELAFGTDPLAPNSVPAPAVVIEGGYLTTTITKQPCLRYLVETSATPESGFSATSTTVLTDTAATLKVHDNVSIGTQPARFLRVQVTAAP